MIKTKSDNDATPNNGWRRLSALCWGTRKRRVFGVLVLAIALAAISFYSLGQSAAPKMKRIDLSTEPLYVNSGGDKPTLTLALSVEFPTVGAQYVWDPAVTNSGNTSFDDSYRSASEYIGYYDAEACYTYNNLPKETVPAGFSRSDYKRFDRSGAAKRHQCADAFSGNFLNWVSSSAIDMLRLALSGGDRYIDTETLTILQRAVLPVGDPVCMWNSVNFPAKKLSRTNGSTNNFDGAVPQEMVAAAGVNDIWVANMLDRIYFRADNGPAGNCNYTADYRLTSQTPWLYKLYDRSDTDLPRDAIKCADDGEICAQTADVNEMWYGANRQYRVFLVAGGVTCNSTNFTDPIAGSAKSCFVRPATSAVRPPSPVKGLNSDGFFYARVSVCTSDASQTLLDVRDYGLCTAYPAGNYKPTGVVQKYSDQMRLATFSYVLDSSASWAGGRYGAVLRAPMKYVGQNTFDIYGVKNTVAGGNPKAEWNAANGILNANPDNDTTQTPPISGVINYLNKFGRTGIKGRYKLHDPMGELHYEALRYLQGLQPTPDAVSNLTPSMYDGYPAATRWTDPYGDGRSNTENYACLKSNIVVFGDINTNDGNRLPQPSMANNIPDIRGWTDVVRNFEANNTSTYIDGQNVARITGNPNGGNGRAPSNQIVGSAYWAHSHDIRGTAWTAEPLLQRPGLRVKTLAFDVNEWGDESNVNTRRYASQLFMAAKYGGYETDSANSDDSPFNSFGNPFKRQDGTNDNAVWQKEEDPGEAKAYYMQSSARGVLAAFAEIFRKAGSKARSIAGGTGQSRKTTSVGNVFYQSSFQTGDWSGDVLAVPLNLDSSTSALSVGLAAYWSASRQLLAMAAPAATRNIYVGRPGSGTSPNASAFTWNAIKGTSLVDDLNKPEPSAAADGVGEDRLMYLRGDRTKEGRPFRVRTKLLGDVINSAVVYSGKPSGTAQSVSHAAFSAARQNRTPAVFVGANDGMLHAFNATVSQPDSGKELFAYIPSWMGPRLSALTAPTYLDAHQSYVDGTPTVTDAQIAQSGAATDWRTVLVSGTGAGGKGVFALDVTDPATFSEKNVMWEFTTADDADMGNVVGKTQILKIRKNAVADKTPAYGWYAVVPSGVNNYAADSNGIFSSTGEPALFFLDITKAPGIAWTLNKNYFKVSLPTDATLSVSKGPGLINFTASLNGADAVAKIYAGDLHGNLWKLDFSRAKQGSADWTMAKLSAFNRGTSSNTTFPLYTAKDATGEVQPITVAPLLVRGDSNGVTYVTVGTGKYLEKGDNDAAQINSVYAIFDTDATLPADGSTGPQIAGRDRLQAPTVPGAIGKITMPAFTWGHASSNADKTRRSGWYFDFPASGERQISNALIFGDSLIFGSLVANASVIAQSCIAGGAGGGGSEYQVNIDTGNGEVRASKVGILGQPFLTDLPSATTYPGELDNTGQQVKIIRAQSFQQGSLGIAASNTLSFSVTVGRLSWRQINNYQELKNMSPP